MNDLITRFGVPYRGDCPKCGGKNSFTIGEVGNAIVYNCFKADCTLKGRHTRETQIKDMVDCGDPEDVKVSSTHNFDDVRTNYAAYAQIKDFPAAHNVNIKYDPKEDRLVFINDTVTLGKGKNPKWKVYSGSTDVPFLVPKVSSNDHPRVVWEPPALCLVEDCISACAVAEHMDAAALMGTKLSYAGKILARKYSVVYIALDPDAYWSASKIAKQLFGLVEVRLLLLPADPKNLTKQQLLENFGGV